MEFNGDVAQIDSIDESFIILGKSSPQTSLDAAMMESKIMEHSKSSKSSSNDEAQDVIKSSISDKGCDNNLYNSCTASLDEAECPVFKPLINGEPLSIRSGLAMNSSMDVDFLGNVETKIVDLVKENEILKLTLAKNNTLMKDQFKNIAKWQDDMMNTHKMHKVKFGETKVLIEKLRMEKSELKQKVDQESQLNTEYRNQIDSLAVKLQAAEKEIEVVKTKCATLTLENDKLNKNIMDINKVLLTKVSKLEKAAQENDKMQKELESLKQSANSVPEKNNSECARDTSITSLEDSFVAVEEKQSKYKQLEETIDQLSLQLEMVEKQRRQVILDNDTICKEKELLDENIKKMSVENGDLKLVIRGMEEKVKRISTEKCQTHEDNFESLKNDLQSLQEKLTTAENKKSEYEKLNTEFENKVKYLNENISELKVRIREAHTVTFQPMRYSLSLEDQSNSSEFSNFIENIKLYDKTLKDIAAHLNQHSQLYADLFNAINNWLIDIELFRDSKDSNAFINTQTEKIKIIKEIVSGFNMTVSTSNHQVKSSLDFLEKLFLDYQQVLKINKDFEEKSLKNKDKLMAIDALSAKIVQLELDTSEKEKERTMLVDIIKQLQKESDERGLLRAQMDIYKADFEAERESRTRLASEKEELLSNLREIQKRNQHLVTEMDKMQSSSPGPSRIRPQSNGTAFVDSKFQEVYTCPKCNLHTLEYQEMDRHLTKCLELK